MTISIGLVLMLIGAILLILSSFVKGSPVSLFNLGWGFVVLAWVFGVGPG